MDNYFAAQPNYQLSIINYPLTICVGMTRFELATPSSRTKYATNCATSRSFAEKQRQNYYIFFGIYDFCHKQMIWGMIIC